ncbi:hypothetical protein FRX31_011110 [Thalictrum thalictroides]|uniref:Defensin-like protein n=1 Tax=Thalictrum thalictroides TaxID=46969 RepID=A0A7J6WPK0_THATH|nr:hypothetical protein FRX31_011110 [Thalictrum thalictroides]
MAKYPQIFCFLLVLIILGHDTMTTKVNADNCKFELGMLSCTTDSECNKPCKDEDPTVKYGVCEGDPKIGKNCWCHKC